MAGICKRQEMQSLLLLCKLVYDVVDKWNFSCDLFPKLGMRSVVLSITDLCTICTLKCDFIDESNL